MPSPVLLPDRSQQQQVHELPHVCRSAFYGLREDVTLETGDSKPTRVSLSFLTLAKTWPGPWARHFLGCDGVCREGWTRGVTGGV